LVLTQIALLGGLGPLFSAHYDQYRGLYHADKQDQFGTNLAYAQSELEDEGSNVEIPQSGDVSVLSLSSRYDLDLGSFHIIGELINNSDVPIKNIKLNATFFDSESSILGTASGQAYLDYLRPGEKSAFDIAAYDESASRVSNFSYYKVSKSSDSVQELKPSMLDLDLRDVFVDACGYYRFVGTVVNYGKDPATDIILSAAFYNNKNQIIESAFITVSGSDNWLSSAKYLPFELSIDGRFLSQFSYYSFNIQSAEYTSTTLDGTVEYGTEDFFDYRNGSPLIPASMQQLSSTNGILGTPNIMTVSTDFESYPLGPNDLQIDGIVPRQDGKDWNEHDNDLYVLVKTMTASGVVLDRIPAPITANGSFSTNVQFAAEQGSGGQLYRIRAEFNGTAAAEDNFFIRYGNILDSKSAQETYRSVCKPSDLVIDKLSLTPRNHVNATDAVDFGNGTSGVHQPEKRQVDLGTELTLSVTAENKLNRIQPATTVIQVFDGKGSVVFLHFEKIMLYPNTEQETSGSWTPGVTGHYTIESFVISGLSEPRILSRPTQMLLDVT
jgi:hypothetical protein